jgi:hypothetical protein
MRPLCRHFGRPRRPILGLLGHHHPAPELSLAVIWLALTQEGRSAASKDLWFDRLFLPAGKS